MKIKNNNSLPAPRVSQLLRLPPWFVYLFSIAVTLFTLWVRMQIVVDYERRTLMLLFMLPIIISAYLGGLWAGLLSTATTAVCVFYFVIPPAHSFEIAQSYDLIQFIVLLTSGVLVSILNESLHRSSRRIEEILNERSQMERALHASEENYRDLVENSQILICTHDLAGNFLSVNEAAVKLTGYSRETLLKTNIKRTLFSNPEEQFAVYIKDITTHGRAKGTMQVRLASGEMRTWAYENSLRSEGLAEPIVRGFAQDITERLRVEEENAKLARFPAENPNPVMRVDLNGCLTFANKASAPLLELWGCQVNEYLPQEYKELVVASIANGHSWADLPCGDRVFSFLIAPIRNENYVNIYAMDTTQRKHAEELLRESEANLSALIENTDGSIWAVNKQYGLIVGNSEFLRNMSAVIERPLKLGESVLLSNFPLQVNIEWQGYYDRALQGERFTHEAQTRFREEPHYIEYRFNPIRNVSGEICGVTVYGHDITDRKQAEELMKYQVHLLENVNDAIVASDKNYILTAWNTAAERIYGWKAKEVLGRKGTDIIQTTFSDHDKDKMLESIAVNGFYRGEATQIRKDGTRFPVDISSIVLHDNQGLVSGYVSVNRDITERELAQEQLLKTLEELERSNSELEQFAYVASHDLQEPLRAVAGMVQLLQKRYHGQLDERADEYINLAMDGSTRMQTLITDLLAYSRVDRRGNPIQPTDANEALRSALRNLQEAIQQSGATVRTGTLPKVKADATQLTQLFQNLIGNAIKFCSENPPQIHIAVEELADAGHFSVRDNGIGIEPQYFERIFLVFQRLHTRREYPGTGIGLSICKKIVERHGGRIWVESEPGQGTTFHFTIPHRS